MPYDKTSKSKWWLSMIAIHGSEEEVRKVMADRIRKLGKQSTSGGFASDKVGKDGLTGRERAAKYGGLNVKKS